MSTDTHEDLPLEARDLLEQHKREVAALRDQGTRQSNAARRDVDLQITAVQLETDRRVQSLREQAERAAGAIVAEVKQELTLRRQELLEQLADLHDAFSGGGSREDAEAVARLLRRLETEPMGDVQPAPTNLEAFRGRIGESFLFSVVGSSAGPLWGTDVYTTDSSPAKAAVHAGLLRIGESGTVRVTIVERLPNYAGTTRHGITSSPWHDPWHGAYRIEAAI